MSIQIANVVIATDNFQTLIDVTNKSAHAISTQVLNANTTLGETSGNSRLYGIFSANTLVAETSLRGGNNSTSNTLTISSELNVSNTLTVSGNASFGNISSNTRVSVGNSLLTNNSLNVGNTAVINSSGIFYGNVVVSNTYITIGNTVINSTTLAESSNNSNFLDGANWASPKVIGNTTPNSAFFTSTSIEKLIANGSVGNTTTVLKSDGSGNIFWGVGGEGFTGSRGLIGYTGSAGVSGSNGQTGFTGSAGVSGSNGALGYTGSIGSSGSIGYTGSSGTANATPQFSALGVGTAAGNTGTIRATGDITASYSDDRLKIRIENISDALHKVNELNGFYYRPNDTAQALGYVDKIEIGVSAQEVEKQFPELVTEAPIDSKYLTVKYDKLVPVLIEAIKELTYRLDILENS